MKKIFLKVISVLLSAICLFSSVNFAAFADYDSLDAPEITATLLDGTKKPTIQLNWSRPEHDSTNMYYIYRRASSEKKYTLIAKTKFVDSTLVIDPQSYNDDTVKENTVYYYKIKGIYVYNKKVYGKSELSAAVSCSSAVNKPVITAEAVSESKIKLSWDKVDGASRYYIYYSTSKNGTYKSIGYTKKTSYTFKNLKSSTRYYFKVKAAKVSNKKVYKSVYSDVASQVTYDKNGEFIVEFDKISNKEAGLPTGSAITCLSMILNHYGVKTTPEELLPYFNCSDKFYYKNGELWGPSPEDQFVGDPTSDKAYSYGIDLGAVRKICEKYLTDLGEDLVYNYFLSSRNPVEFKQYLKEGHICLVLLNMDNSGDSYNFYYNSSDGTKVYSYMGLGEKYVIACGYTENAYIIYDPATEKYEKWDDEPGFFRFSAFMAFK